jgi:arylsulfatase A-like enzyme
VNSRRWQGLLLAQSLAIILLGLSFVRIAGDAQSKGFRGAVLSTVFGGGSIWGTTLVQNLVLFSLALLFVHLLFGFLCWLIARGSAVAWPSKEVPPWQHVFIWFILMTIALLAHNAASFPRSSLGSPYAKAMMIELAGISLGIWIALAVLGAAVVTLGVAARKHLDRLAAFLKKPVFAAVAAGILAAVVAIALPSRHTRVMPHRQPNVILIGLDSLRRDVVAPDTSTGITPNVDAFLSRATSFSNVYTPLARTFPSVTSLITGRSPHRTGAVVNLLPRDLIDEGDTLGRMFGRAGYSTVYGIDEVRFSNIDTSYGFDQAITPPIGASEFLLSLFADTPLSNLLVSTSVGRVLFPHIHANRGAALIYDPDMYLERLDSEIDFASPMLLHVHLTLSHWPYTWIDAPVPRTAFGEKSEPSERWPQYYRDAVHRADRQFGDLMAMLERRGLLANAIVVLYSDHGESFGYDHESMAAVDASAIVELGAKPRYGHGTSVLASDQYHCVLGIRGYGAARLPASESRTIEAPVMLQDVAPTLVELVAAQAKVEPKSVFDGRSLAALLRGESEASKAFEGRIRFTETEYDPANVIAANGQVSASAVAKAIAVYRVDPLTDRLEIHRERIPGLLRARQYAALDASYLVAALPTEAGFRYIAVDRRDGTIRRVSGAPDAAAPMEIHALWRALHAEYGALLNAPIPAPVSASPLTLSHHAAAP